MRNVLALILVLAFSINVNAQDSRLPGDMDGDSLLTATDLVRMLGLLNTDYFVAAADMNGDDKNDVFDLLALIHEVAKADIVEQPFEYALVINQIRVLDYSLVWSIQTIEPEYPHQKLSYVISTSRDLDNFTLTFNGNVITDSLHGELPQTFSKDTLAVKLRDYIDRNFFDFYFYVDSIPWSLKLEDTEGNTLRDSGFVKVDIDFDVIVDGGPNFYGRKISFPVVLNDPDQRFTYRNILVDLNPDRLPSVVYHDIRSLCRAINGNSSSTYQYVRPAYNYAEEKEENIVAIHIRDWGWPSPPEPLDGNTLLLDKIGFPEWIRELPPHDIGWYVFYRD